MEPVELVGSAGRLPGGAQLLELAARQEGIWLVGGAVRDLLLGREPTELDLLVEGDLEVVARELGEPVFHERFGTATVTGPLGRFDLARPRSERYPAPGALPEVERASVQEDLSRRDFTINAIAVRLPDGPELSHPQAHADLEAGILRVLHEDSFADDPTRVWRMARYAARLGFVPDEHTAELARAAGPGQASGERIGAELRLMLEEKDPCRGFEALARYCPQALPPGFAARPAAIDAALELLPPDGDRGLTVLACCCSGMDLDELARWLSVLGMAAADRDLVLAASRWVTGAPLRTAAGPVEVARAARGAPPEAVAIAGGPNAALWLQELRHVALEIDGDDLIAAGVPPGPAVGEALQRALDAKLEGRCRGREQEIAAALGKEAP